MTRAESEPGCATRERRTEHSGRDTGLRSPIPRRKSFRDLPPKAPPIDPERAIFLLSAFLPYTHLHRMEHAKKGTGKGKWRGARGASATFPFLSSAYISSPGGWGGICVMRATVQSTRQDRMVCLYLAYLPTTYGTVWAGAEGRVSAVPASPLSVATCQSEHDGSTKGSNGWWWWCWEEVRWLGNMILLSGCMCGR